MKKFSILLGFFIISAVVIELLMLITHPSPAAFARPSEILLLLPGFLPTGPYWRDLVVTACRALASFLLSIPVGFILGIVTIQGGLAKTSLSFILDFLRSIPATALVPIFLVTLGLGEIAKISVGIFSGSLVIALAVMVGLSGLNEDRALVADILGLVGWRRLYLYEFVEALPSMFIGLRSASSLCLVVVVVSEMFIGADHGLGKLIMDSRYSDQVPLLYTSIFASGALGYLLNEAVRTLEIFLSRRLALERS